MSILRKEDNLCKSRKNGWRSEVSRSSLVAQSGGKRVGREQDGGRKMKKLRYDLVEDDLGQVKTTQNRDMKMSPNGSNLLCQREQQIHI